MGVGSKPINQQNNSTPNRAAFLAALAGLTISLLFAWGQQQRNDQRVSLAFDTVVDKTMSRTKGSFEQYDYGLHGLRGLLNIAGADRLNAPQFARYLHSREFKSEFEGAMGFGFIRRVSEAEEAEYVEASQKADNQPFKVRSLGNDYQERFLIRFIEPFANNASARGLDIASEVDRRTAALAAMRSGTAKLTAPITLVQAEGETESGFLFLLPTYDTDDVPETVEERMSGGIGWAYAPLLASGLLAHVIEPQDEILVTMRDATTDANAQIFFSTLDHSKRHGGELDRTQTLEIFGRKWEVRVAANNLFTASLNLLDPKVILATGVIGTFLLALLVRLILGSIASSARVRDEKAELTLGVIDASPQAIFVVDSGGKILQTNRRVTDLFGYEERALIGAQIETLLPKTFRDPHVDLRQGYDHKPRMMGTRGNLMALHASGHEFHVQVHLASLKYGDQTVVVAGVMDVSKEYLALEKLTASEARWSQLANSMPQLVWTADSNGELDFLNSRWLAYTGKRMEEQRGRGWLDQIHPDDRSSADHRWTMSVKNATVFESEFRLRRRDGKYRWFFSQGVPVLGKDGQANRWIGSNTDIQDRRRAEDETRELNLTLEARVDERTALLDHARRDLRNILDSVPSMVAYWDTELKNRFANQAYAELHNVTTESIEGMSMREVVSEENYAEVEPHITDVLKGEHQIFETTWSSRTSREQRIFEVRYIPDIIDGDVKGYLAFSTDVTELRMATKEAQEANSAKSMFLANMSHEIRTPMNAVINLTYLLEQSEMDADQQDLLSKIKIASRSLLGLINDILDLSKIEAGQMQVSAENFNLRSSIQDVVNVLSAQAATKNIELSTSVDKEVPSYVRGDGMRLGQILTNLLGNAIKFTEAGSVRLNIANAKNNRAASMIRFEVEDSGIGISEEALKKLFQPFTQADASTTRRFGGSGLGLAIVRRLVGLMGGELGAESKEGKGSRFWFEIPLEEQSEGMHASESPRPLETLIIDDAEDQQESLAKVTRSLGWRNEIASSGKEALERLVDREKAGKPFDVIIVDANMPEMDGVETLKEIRASDLGKSVTAVLITAYGTERLNELEGANLADSILQKPASSSTLFNAIHESIASRTGSNRGLLKSLESGDLPDGPRLPSVNILLVDDSQINLDVGRRILEQEMANVTEAVNGRQAVEILRESPDAFDLVLMDVQMPVLDGHAASREIRNTLKLTDLPIVALTAGALVSERERAHQAGMNEFISKPFDAPSMIRRIRNIVEQSRGRPLPTAQHDSAEALASKKDTENSKAWPSIAGIDGVQASNQLAGDRVLFKKSLAKMLSEFSTGFEDDGDAGHDPEWVSLRIQRAHKLRGAAGNLGAKSIFKLTGEIEDRLRNDPGHSVSGMLTRLRRELQKLQESSAEFLNEPEEITPKSPGSSSSSSLDPEKLERLLELLRSQSLEAMTEFEIFKPDLNAIMSNEAFLALTDAIDNLNFVEALELMPSAQQSENSSESATTNSAPADDPAPDS